MKKLRNSHKRIKQINAIEAKIKFYKYTASRNFQTRDKWEKKVIPLESKLEKLKTYFSRILSERQELYVKRVVNNTEVYVRVYFCNIEYVTNKSVMVYVNVKEYGQIVEFVKVEFENIYYN